MAEARARRARGRPRLAAVTTPFQRRRSSGGRRNAKPCGSGGLDELETGQALEDASHGDRALQARHVEAEAVVHAEAEGEVVPGVLAADVEAERVGRRPRGRGWRRACETPTNSPRPSSTSPSAVGAAVQRSMKATGGISRIASSTAFADELGLGAHGVQLVGVLEQEQHRVHHHRLDRLDRAEEDHAQLGDDLVVGQLRRRRRSRPPT